ncbi:hypothetical protein J2Z66_003396 [Paenibacillus eucommiae]|uniref:Uncharacterized protein n=1 Tax=Paenibacillus eucommiae TaxID=1355755 RepID=A0ABS4IW40_9BACL|nr:hypothetical protein [Paenibacillus eucommiae]
MLLTMKNIVKVAVGAARALHPHRVRPPGKSPPIKRKNLAGCPFELGVSAIRAAGAHIHSLGKAPMP